MVLSLGLLRDGTSTEKESHQCCSVDGSGYVPKNTSKATGWALRV